MIKKILYILTIVFFNACVNGPQKEIENIKRKVISSPFIGKWESLKRAYPYKSHLILYEDSTFHFGYGACAARGFSRGKWTGNNSKIILNSDKTDSCMFLSFFGQECFLIDENDTSENILEKTKHDCNPTNYEKEYIKFTNEEFYIENDTLKYIEKKGRLYSKVRNDFRRIIDATVDRSYTQ